MTGEASAEAKTPLLLFGAGGLAADIIDIIHRIGGLTVAGLVVDRDRPAMQFGSLPVYHWSDVEHRASDFHAVNAMGRPARRSFIERAEAAGYSFLTLIDPSAQIFPTASIGRGCIVGAGTIVAAGARIGDHVFLNRGVLIGHHATVDPFASLQAGARIGGYTRIGDQVEIGIGATLVDRIAIGPRAVIGAGAVVLRDAPADVVMVGVPARPIRR